MFISSLYQNEEVRIVPPLTSAPKEELSLYEFYNNYFEGVIADTEQLVDECYKLRYQIYCLEREGYEDAGAFPDQCERDVFDKHSIHALLRHRPSGAFVGTVRLILEQSENQNGSFPLDKICEEQGLALPLLKPRRTLGEISRFSISRSMRRRAADVDVSGGYTAPVSKASRARIIPCMALGLMTMVNKISQTHGVDHYCAIMEPSLLRLLDMLGMHFRGVGPLVDYHGKRQVCYVTVDEMRESLKIERPDVLEVLTERGRYP